MLQTLLSRDDIPQDIRKVIIDEISEREALEIELHEFKSKYFTITNNQLIGILIYQDQHIVEVNDAHASMVGYDKDEILSFSFRELMEKIHPEDSPVVIKAVEDFIRGIPQSPKYEYRLIHKNGSIIWVEAYFTLIDYQGKRALQSIFIDITDRKQAEESLKESEENFRNLFNESKDSEEILRSVTENSFDMILRLDLNYKVQFINRVDVPGGLRREDIFGKEAFIHVDPAQQIQIKEKFDEVVSQKKAQTFETVFNLPTGSIVCHESIASPIIIKNEVTGLVVNTRNITDRKQAEKKLQEEKAFSEGITKSLPGVFFSYVESKGEYKLIKWNEQTQRMLGLPPEEMLGIGPLDLVHPEDIEKVELAIKRAEIKGVATIEARIRAGGVGYRNYLCSAALSELNNKKYLTGVGFDLSSRIKAEEALRESEANLNSIFRVAPSGIGVLQDRVFKYVNDFFVDMVGYSQDELLGQSTKMLYQKTEDYERFQEEVYPEMEKSGVGTYELELKRKDRKVICVQARITNTDPSNPSAGVTFTALDVTEWKKAEKLLRESEAKLSSIIKGVPSGIGILKNREFSFVNDFFLDLTGYSRDELIGKSTEMLYLSTEEFKSFGEELYQEIEKTGIGTLEGQLKRKDSEILDVQIRITPIDPSDASKGMVFIALDITRRKQTEEALKKSEENYRSLINNIPAVTWISDRKGATSFISPNVEQIYGFSPQEILSSGSELWFDRIHRKDIDRVKEMYENHFINKKAFDIEYRIQRKDGNWIWLHDKAVEQFEEGKEQFSYGVFMDVTYQKEIEEELRTKEAQLRESEEKLRGIFINSQDGIFLTDEQGLISEWNTPMEVFTGLKHGEIKGKSIWDTLSSLLPKTQQFETIKELIEGKISESLKKGITDWLLNPFEINIQSQTGKVRFVQISLFVVPRMQAFLVGGICRDQTQMHEVETRMMKEILRYNIEDGSIYLIKEPQPLLAKDIFKDLLQIGYRGLILSRTPEKEYTHSFIGEITHLWLSKQRLLKGSTLIDHIVLEITQLSPRSVILLDSLDYLAKLYSSKEIVALISNLRDIAIINRQIILISVDTDLISEKDLKFLEKETKGVEPRTISKMSTELFELLKYIYFQNNLGVRPSYTQIVNKLETTRPTARKRVRELLMKAYVRETSVGRTKVFELTQKGINLFLSS